MLRTTTAIAGAVLLFAAALAPAQETRPTSDPARIGEGDPDFDLAHHLKSETDAPLYGDMIQFEQDGVEVHGYISEAKEPRPGEPALVVIHEWWGLNKHIKETADALAGNGYTALAVDLYGGATAESPEQARALMQKVDMEEAVARLRAAVDYLRRDDADRLVGSIGWCFGGGYSAQLAVHEPTLDACVIFYGRLPQSVEEVSKIQAPVLGIFAANDRSIDAEMVAGFRSAAEEAGVNLETHVFDADHAFANPSGARFDEEAAIQAWKETYDFLSENLAR